MLLHSTPESTKSQYTCEKCKNTIEITKVVKIIQIKNRVGYFAIGLPLSSPYQLWKVNDDKIDMYNNEGLTNRCDKDSTNNKCDKELTNNRCDKDLTNNKCDKDLTNNRCDKDLTNNRCDKDLTNRCDKDLTNKCDKELTNNKCDRQDKNLIDICNENSFEILDISLFDIYQVTNSNYSRIMESNSKAYCEDCIFKWISKYEIIPDNYMLECYKCKNKYKNYQEFKDIISVYYNTSSDVCEGQDSQCSYRLNQGDKELIKTMNEDFQNKWAKDHNYYNLKLKDYINTFSTWICRSCLYDVGFPPQVRDCLYNEEYNLPMCLCTTIGQYLTPPFVENICMICDKIFLDCDQTQSHWIEYFGYFDLDRFIDKYSLYNFQYIYCDAKTSLYSVSNGFICCDCVAKLIDSKVLKIY